MPAQVEKMAFVTDRGLPWWVGIEQGEAVGLDKLATATEMIEESGLGWNVGLETLTTASGTLVPGKFASVRSTDGAVLGVVGRQYQVIQNAEAFQFADNLVDDGQAKYETAGSLRGGQVVFLAMELNHLDLTLDGDDVGGNSVKTYLLLSNSHDGSRALEADITKVRVVCANTLNVAIKGASRRFRIRHSGSIDGKLTAARKALGIAFTYDKAFEAAAQKLISKKVVDQQVEDIFRRAVWPIAEDANEARLDSHPSTLAFATYKNSDNLAPIRGTAWGALNAVAEFVDHEQEYRGRHGSSEDVRTNSILWGTAQARKQAAFEALLKV